MSKLRKYFAITRISLLEAIQYKSEILGRFVFYTMFISIFFCLWQAIYQNNLGNEYSFEQMIWYLCISELITFGCRTNIYSQLQADVKTGNIAYMLAKPLNYVLYQLALFIGSSTLNLFTFGSYACLLGCFYAGYLPNFSFWQLPFILASIIMGITLNFLMMLILGLTAFVWEENSGFYFVYQKLVFMLGMFIPIEFLPSPLQEVARKLPFSYVAWAPAKLAVDFSWPSFDELFLNQVYWNIVFATLAFWVYDRATKSLQGQGG